VGDEKLAKILKLSQQDKKISLSFRQGQLDAQKIEYQKYSNSQESTLTLGDLMKDQLGNLETSIKKNASKKETKKETTKKPIKKAKKEDKGKDTKKEIKKTTTTKPKKETKKDSKKEIKKKEDKGDKS
jgi:small subunit ribosomal protein S1